MSTLDLESWQTIADADAHADANADEQSLGLQDSQTVRRSSSLRGNSEGQQDRSLARSLT